MAFARQAAQRQEGLAVELKTVIKKMDLDPKNSLDGIAALRKAHEGVLVWM
jgi:hypothetical protein